MPDRKINFGDAYTPKITQIHSFGYCECEQYIFETHNTYIRNKVEFKDGLNHNVE